MEEEVVGIPEPTIVDAPSGAIARLSGALEYFLKAMDTGRSEPLFIARDNARRVLEELRAGDLP
jgi:hypothetical protein